MSEPGKLQSNESLRKFSKDPSKSGNGINMWVIVGYLSSFLGGVPGMFIGSMLLTAKRALPGGQVVYIFNKRSRKHGKIILYLGCVILILAILFL